MPDHYFFAPLLAISAAMLFGLSSNFIKKGLAYVDAQTASLLSITTTWFCFLVFTPFWMQSIYWQSPAVWVFALIGLIQPVLSRYLAYEANIRVGPTVAATFDAVTPLFSAFMAIVFLGESLTWEIALGTVVIMSGVMVASWHAQGLANIMRIALLFAVGAAFIRALTTNVGRYGMLILPNAMMAAFVSFCVSVVVSMLAYRFRKGSFPRQLPRGGILWCSIAGMISTAAVSCLFGALLYGKVIVVSPLFATYPIFTLGFAILLRVESPTRRIATAVFMVVGGVALVTMRPGS